MNTTHIIATLQIYIKQTTDKDVEINPNIGMRDFGKLFELHNIAKRWLDENVIETKAI